MHDKVIEVFLMVQEMAELLSHALLHTGLLCADEALQHHPACNTKGSCFDEVEVYAGLTPLSRSFSGAPSPWRDTHC